MLYSFIVDLKKNTITDNKIAPTQPSPEHWLYAVPNKYPKEIIY
jgi:hypothetical protein